MSVNAAPGAAQIKGIPEERRARGLFEIERWPSEEDAIAIRSGKGQHEDVRRLDAFFLHAGGRNVDLISSEIRQDSQRRKISKAQHVDAGSGCVVGSKGLLVLTRLECLCRRPFR